MKKIYLLLLYLTGVSRTFADTVYVSSKTDPRLLAYKDTLYAYETGKSICDNLAILFQKLTNTHDYDSYFLDAWSGAIQFDQPVDTLLGFSVFLPNDRFPNEADKRLFSSNSEIGQKITFQFRRLDSIKVMPYAKVEGSEMPIIFIYTKPTRVVLYKKLDRCWEKKMLYTTIDIQTHFIVNKKDKTIIPYNIRKHYQVKDDSSILIKTEWVDPVDQNKIIKTFGSLK